MSEASDVVQIATAVLTFLSTAISAYLAYRLALLKADVGRVEKHTNGLKDSLIARTREAAYREGQQDAAPRQNPDTGGKP